MSLDLTTPQFAPAEFAERLSEQLLLQPDTEYIFARWAYSAKMQEELSGMNPSAWDLAKLQMMEGRLSAGTGPAANLAEAMSSGMGGPMMLSLGVGFPDMIKMVKEAKLPGETIKINRPVFLNGSTTYANRIATPTTKLFGTNSQAIQMQQVGLTIVELLGPCDINGNLSPISLPRFTAHRSAHDLFVDVGFQLRRDRYRVVDDKIQNDAIAAALGAGNVTYPVGVSSAAGMTAANNEPMSFDLIVMMAKAMKDRFIPGVGGEPFYPLVLDTNQIAQLKLDPMYQRLGKYHERFNPLFPGYISTVDAAIVIESTRLPQLANQGVGSNVTVHQGIMCAPNAYGWGSAQDASALRNRNDDGGRNNEFGWNAYDAFDVLDARFFQLVQTD